MPPDVPKSDLPALPVTAVTAADARYPDLVRGWNQRFVCAPETVFLPTTTDEVAEAVRRAVRDDKRLSIRSGGHCWEDFVHHPDVRIVLDMSALKAVYFDPEHDAFAVEAGALLLDVYERLYRGWGVTVPGGMCFQVGAGGHVSGGGWGLLCRRLGLVVDHLYAVEVVVVDRDGTVRTVVATREDDDPARELWWAHTGGGGGNFGVVTRYWFRSPDTGTPTGREPDPAALLPRPPAEVWVSAISWQWDELGREDFVRLVANYSAWQVAHRAPGDPYSDVCSLLSLNHRSNGAIGLITQVAADDPGSLRQLEDFLAAVTAGVRAPAGPVTTRMGEHGPMPELARPRRLPWMQATRYLGTANPTTNDPTQKGAFKSSYMRRDFPARHIDALYRHLAREDGGNPTASVMLSSFGGAVAAADDDATAFPHRDAAFKLAWMIWWDDPADEAGCLTWLREFYEDVYAETGGVPVPGPDTDGAFVNYPDRDLSDPARNRSSSPWHELYYKANYPRLQRAKKRWDPRDVFRHRQSVRLPSPGGAEGHEGNRPGPHGV
ncbi:FAD-binding oxidoreductase [Streptomyces sp. NPDC048211]|uniref:FAD-binding oxidoreductase n=1 Tax=Streptomyces sp. NPDC048211 TaxID=3365516 RepID=UPI0037224112